MHRFNVNFSDSAWKSVEEMADKLGIDRGDVLRESLSMFAWAMDQVESGTILLRIPPGEDWPKEIYFPSLAKLGPDMPDLSGGAGLGQGFREWLRNRHVLEIAVKPL